MLSFRVAHVTPVLTTPRYLQRALHHTYQAAPVLTTRFGDNCYDGLRKATLLSPLCRLWSMCCQIGLRTEISHSLLSVLGCHDVDKVN